MGTEATPSLASLDRAHARQHATMRLLRPLGLGMIVLVEITAARTEPRPGLGGERLGVLLALIGFAVGVGGVLYSHKAPRAVQAGFFAVLLASSAAAVWLQPRGPGFLGILIAVGATGVRVRGRLGAAVAAFGLVALAVAGTLASRRQLSSIVLTELGVSTMFVLAVLANRWREGQEQAERLLLELEASRAAQARAAALAERQRLAREMHDVLARAGLVEARRAIGTLRDEELPGPERLEVLAREFERDAGVPCALEVTGQRRELGSEARLTLYRVAQEALTNARKHASPRRVELRLAYEPDGTRLTVEDFGDDGPAAGRRLDDHRGYGLTGMRERAELLGGRLSAAANGSGFRVELWVPV